MPLQPSQDTSTDLPPSLRVAYLAAGAAGMYCGSCMRDNRLAATLIRQGRDILLYPLYTPIRTDEQDVSIHHIYYGGINVYLEQKLRVLRRPHRLLDRILDSPSLLNHVSAFAAKTDPHDLGQLTVSVLQGSHGPQNIELEKLIDGLSAIYPTIVNLPNLMFVGVAAELNARLNTRVFCTLAGEDIFLDALPDPFRQQSLDLIAESARHIDAFVSPTSYYAAHAARHFGLDPDRIHHVPMGIQLDDIPDRPARPPAPDPTIGYFARICPEKGLHVLVDAFIELRRAGKNCRLAAAGYLGAADKPYLDEIHRILESENLTEAFTYAGEPDRAGKIEFLHGLDVFCVPTTYVEAKGFYILEALACGLPVVQPDHGSFPELIEATGGGILYNPQTDGSLAQSLSALLDDPEQRRTLADNGHRAVRESFSDTTMADAAWALYERYAKPNNPINR